MNEKYTKQIKEAEMEGLRTRGRSRREWNVGVKKALSDRRLSVERGRLLTSDLTR